LPLRKCTRPPAPIFSLAPTAWERCLISARGEGKPASSMRPATRPDYRFSTTGLHGPTVAALPHGSAKKPPKRRKRAIYGDETNLV